MKNDENVPALPNSISVGCVIDKNVDYHLYDIANGKKRTETQQECANFAYATKGAFFWKWHPNDKMCYLKNSNAKKGKKTRSGAVVGNINCGREGEP